MKLAEIFQQAKEGRPDLAAANLGSCGFSPVGLRVIARYQGPWIMGIKDYYRAYSRAQRQRSLAHHWAREVRSAREYLTFALEIEGDMDAVGSQRRRQAKDALAKALRWGL